jgi:DNA-binding CsgD family transcriptional regulator
LRLDETGISISRTWGRRDVDVRDHLVDQIYEAAVLPDRWPAVLQELAAIGDGEGGLLFTIDANNQRWIGSPDIVDRMKEYIAAGWPARTDRPARLLAKRHAGFIDDLDVYTPEELETEPVFAEFLRPRGLGRGVATAIPVPTGDTLLISVERAYHRGPSTRAALHRLDELRPHLARAALLSARLRLEGARTVAGALGLVGLPAAVLSDAGRALAVNQLLEALMPGTLRDQRGRLVLTDPAADALLAEALTCLATSSQDEAGRSIPLRSRERQPPMILHLLPVRRGAQDVFAGASSILVLTAMLGRMAPNADVLQGLFDLSPAEARIARSIAERQTVEAIASGLGVSRETVRTQLKAVLAKTGSKRQLDLAVLLAGARLPKAGAGNPFG